jgi:hypothetical protein
VSAKPAARRKPAAKRRATPKRVAAARAEVAAPQDRTVEYRGLTITVPPSTEWGSEIYFLLADGKNAVGFEQVLLAGEVLKEIIGEDQYAMVRAKLREDKVKMHQVEAETVGLFNQIFGEFGTDLGEYNASPAS